MTDLGQPRRPTVAWVRAVVSGKYTSDGVFITPQSEYQIDLLSDVKAAA
jgi:hypothetical protein